MTSDDVLATTQRQDNPTRGRWGLVAAALLLQFSIGAVYPARDRMSARTSSP